MIDSKKLEVAIESHTHKFAINITNCYKEKLIAIPGTATRQVVQDAADIDKITHGVKRIPIKKGDYQTFMYRGVIRVKSNATFIEDPYIEDSHDPNKKLNHHFKLFKVGHVVPLEYQLLRFVYDKRYQLKQKILNLVVTEDNYPVIQWLLQATFNDEQNDYNTLPNGFTQALFNCLTGEGKQFVKVPDTIVESVVGEYDVIIANQEFYEDQIKKEEEALEEKRKKLQALRDKSKGSKKEDPKKEDPKKDDPKKPEGKKPEEAKKDEKPKATSKK